MTHRWLKFWPQDWQRDPALRSCSAASRGVWIDMICIMHEGSPYGHLTIGGKAASNRQIGMLTGVGEKEIVRLIAELEDAGVFSRTADGTIFSRRMVRDYERSEEGRINVGKRWPKANGHSPPNRVPKSGNGREPDTQEYRIQESEFKKREGVNARDTRDAPAPKVKIPEDWFPDEEGRECAKRFGIATVEQMTDVIRHFIDHYAARGTLRDDWQAQWREWCRNEPEFRRNGK